MNFENGYQLELIQRMSIKSFMGRVGDRLHEEMFDPQLTPIVGEVLKRWRKGKVVLSAGQINQLFRKQGVKPDSTPSGDEKFDLDEIDRFARFRSMRQGLAEAHVELEKGRFDRAFQAVEKSYSTGQIAQEPPQDILKESLAVVYRKGLCPTGLPTLDSERAFKGGVGAGEVAVVLAATSGGKTSFLVHLAGMAALLGKKVFYATLEVPREDIYRKLQSRLTGKEKPSKAEWDKARKKLKGSWWLEGYEPGAVSVDDLTRAIPNNADFIAIDYADYLKPSGGDGSLGGDYQSLGSVYTELKALALKRGCPLWTASQANREAYGGGESDPKGKKKSPLIFLHHVEASLKKVMVSDQVISINQTDAEQVPNEKTGNCTALVFVAKNRHGPRFMQIPITVSWAKCGFVEGSFT